jgi:hypothetical protein
MFFGFLCSIADQMVSEHRSKVLLAPLVRDFSGRSKANPYPFLGCTRVGIFFLEVRDVLGFLFTLLSLSQEVR